jgi:hypothetical protein
MAGKLKHWWALIGLLVAATVLTPRAKGAEQTSRPYHLGFTPFPYDISFEAVDFTYQAFATDADLVAHHFDSGVPWVEALAGTPYHPNLMTEWQSRRDKTPANKKIYVSITPVNWGRTELATYRGEKEDMPLPTPWNTYGFEHPDVKAAFVKYAETVIDFFDPAFLNIGIEVNLVQKNAPTKWESYLKLHQSVYTALKRTHPDLPVFVSVTGIDLLDGYTDADAVAQRRALTALLPFTDYFALSLYPYMTGYMTSTVPADMFDDLAALSGGKPMAMAETGYPAQPFTIKVGGTPLTFEGSEAKQDVYMSMLLNAGHKHKFVFIINFVLRDYDALWEKFAPPGSAASDIAMVWRDTGLYDESGKVRPALLTWRKALALPYAAP